MNKVFKLISTLAVVSSGSAIVENDSVGAVVISTSTTDLPVVQETPCEPIEPLSRKPLTPKGCMKRITDTMLDKSEKSVSFFGDKQRTGNLRSDSLAGHDDQGQTDEAYRFVPIYRDEHDHHFFTIWDGLVGLGLAAYSVTALVADYHALVYMYGFISSYF